MKHKTNIAALACGLALWASAGVAGAATSTTSLLNDLPGTSTVTGYANNSSGVLVEKTPVWYSGGYGIWGHSSDDSHTTDNSGRKESLLLSFEGSTKLEAVTIGYKESDSDITVLAWTGLSGQTAPVFNTSTTYANLTSLGWSLVGHYADLATNTAKAVNVANPVSSSYWLVMAYNNSFGSTKTDTSPSNGVLSTGNDYVKFLSVSYSTPTPRDNRVPEPSTALLLGAAMFGLVGLRNRRNAVR